MVDYIDRTIRKKNLTQAESVRMVGVKREDLNRIINRKVNPTLLLGMRIAKALNMPMEDLSIMDNINKVRLK